MNPGFLQASSAEPQLAPHHDQSLSDQRADYLKQQ